MAMTILTIFSNMYSVCFLLGLLLSSLSGSSGSQGSINWTSLIEEVHEYMFNQQTKCDALHYFCKDLFSSSIARRPIRNCECYNNQCMIYGGCCVDEAARKANQGVTSEPQKYMCGYLNLPDKDFGHTSALMVRNCHETFIGSNMEKLCFKQPTDVLYDPLLQLPVISFKTNVTYINYYCAQCNNDAMNLVPMAYNIECVNMTDSDFYHTYIYSLQFPSANDYAMGEISAPEHYLLSESESLYFDPAYIGNEFWWHFLVSEPKSVLRNGKRELLGNSSDLSFKCSIKGKKYKYFRDSRKNYETFPCSYPSKLDQIIECNATWENKEDFEICRSYSLRASIHEREYKNPHCARCNFEDMSVLDVPCRSRKIYIYFRPLLMERQCEGGMKYDKDMKACMVDLW